MAIKYEPRLYSGLTSNPGIYYGPNKVHGIYYGDKLVYPPPMSYMTDFKFGQTTTVSLVDGSKVDFQTVNDGPIYQTIDANGIVSTNTTSSDKVYIPYSYLKQPFNKYEISVSIYLNQNLATLSSGLVLGKPMGGNPYVTLSMGNGLVRVLEGAGPEGRTVLLNLPNDVEKPAVNDKVTLTRSRVNKTEARYAIYINDVEKASATTTLNEHSDSYYAGLFVAYQRRNWGNYFGPSLKNFIAYTF